MTGNPAYEIAALFMARKGYKNVRPKNVKHDPEFNEWLFVYDLNDGVVKLVISWDKQFGWDACVESFTPRR